MTRIQKKKIIVDELMGQWNSEPQPTVKFNFINEENLVKFANMFPMPPFAKFAAGERLSINDLVIGVNSPFTYKPETKVKEGLVEPVGELYVKGHSPNDQYLPIFEGAWQNTKEAFNLPKGKVKAGLLLFNLLAIIAEVVLAEAGRPEAAVGVNEVRKFYNAAGNWYVDNYDKLHRQVDDSIAASKIIIQGMKEGGISTENQQLILTLTIENIETLQKMKKGLETNKKLYTDYEEGIIPKEKLEKKLVDIKKLWSIVTKNQKTIASIKIEENEKIIHEDMLQGLEEIRAPITTIPVPPPPAKKRLPKK